jgi:stage V sporulation protein D (sporulation-specific penicillin-binding protein)
LAAEQWYRDLPLMAERGKILDRNGVVMAHSRLTYSIYIRPVAITDPDAVSTLLANQLGLNRQSIRSKATDRRASEWLIKMQVEKETALNIVSANLDGIFISQTFDRIYPLGTTGGQVLGLVSIDGFGQEGLEAFYNQTLRGTNGRIATASDLRGIPRASDSTQYFTPPVDGLDLVLNVDATIQGILQNALNRAYNEQGARAVFGMVYDIQTGGVLASASAPFYDMNNQPRSDAARLMAEIKNLPIVNVLEPGSTFKILTLAAALEEGVATSSDRFHCPGFRMIGNERVKCWRTKGHGSQDLTQGVMQSCNCVFMDLAGRLGTDKFYDYLKKFGVGQKTGVDFHGEPSGLVLDKRWVRPVDLARIGFGQAVAVSPVQFQSIISALVGGGELKTPRFVSSIPQAGVDIRSETRRQIVSRQTSETVRDMMYAVVDSGSGKHAGVPGYQIGGKTGTAQKYKDGIIDQGHYISSFMGFLSVDGVPRYSVAFYVDEPSKQGYYGSVVAAPYVGEIFRQMIDYLQIPPQNPDTPVSAGLMVEVPHLTGMNYTSAAALLAKRNFYMEVSGEGLNVVGTIPAAGTMLRQGSPVVLITH